MPKTVMDEKTDPEEIERFEPIHVSYRKFIFGALLAFMFPTANNEKKRFVSLGLMYIFLIPLYMMWLHDVSNRIRESDLANLTRLLSLGIPVSFTNTKMILSVLSRKGIKALLDEVSNDYARLNNMPDGFKQIANQTRHFTHFLERIWTANCVMTVLIFPTTAAVKMLYSYFYGDSQRFMMFELTVPFLDDYEIFETPYFELIFAYSFIIGVYLIFCFLGFFGMFTICAMHACLKMEIVCYYLSNTFKDYSSVETVKKRLANIIEEQCKVYRFVELIRGEFQIWLALIFLLTSLQMCFMLFQVLYADGLEIRFVVFVLGAILHCYLPCYLSTRITAKAEEVAWSAYSSGWEVCDDTTVRRSINIMIARAQIPIKIVALNMITFDMELFVSIMQTSFSVFTLLRE